MSDAWWVVLIAGATSMLLKAAGPVVVGGRALPPRLVSLVECLAPALFAALIVTQVFGGNRELHLDERALGLAAGLIAVYLKAPVVLVVTSAALVTALVRLLA